jgi:hypothetical protein
MIDLSVGQQFNAAAFVLHNQIVNENGDPITFDRHKFLLDFYMDESPEICAVKCSQVGFSTTAIIKSSHLCHYRKANVIYLLPSKSIVKDFVIPKVDPLIKTNPALKDMMGNTDNLGLKSFGQGRDQRFLYFRSSWDEDSGISLSAHVVISDEYDRSNKKAVDTYQTRLDASRLTRPDLGFDWRFSNPTYDGAGVDELWQDSDQKRWIIKCSRCNFHQQLTWPESINMKTEEYICKRCYRPLSDIDRINGEWIPTYLGRRRSGYQISQLMATWIPASEIIKDSKGDQSIFYNFTLGLPYTSKDIKVTREALIKCIYPTANPMTNVAMGVDNGKTMHYVIGNNYGIFEMGETDDWEVIEQKRNQYDAYMVIDSNPYPTPPLKLANKYPGKVFVHWYSDDSKMDKIIQWGEGEKATSVFSDRTKIIDAVVADINTQDIRFNMTLDELVNNEFIIHWQRLYRIVIEDAKGIRRGVWRTIGQETGTKKADHKAHATVLWKVAMQLTLSVGAVITTPKPRNSQIIKPAIYVTPDGQAQDNFSLDKLREQFANPKRNKPWFKR